MGLFLVWHLLRELIAKNYVKPDEMGRTMAVQCEYVALVDWEFVAICNLDGEMNIRQILVFRQLFSYL